MQLTDISFDDKGNPKWDLPIPRKPRVSSQGHPLPYLHPNISIARPRPWQRSRKLWLVMALGLLAPAYLISTLGVKVLNGLRTQPKLTGLSRVLHQVAFAAITRWSDEWSSRPVQAPVMLPGKAQPCPVPVDVGMLEPVLVLYAMGVPTTFCCEGHEGAQGVPYIGIESGHRFPESLLGALDQAWLPYCLETFEDGRVAIYDEGEDLRFAAVLRAWAREQGPGLLPDSGLN